MQAGGYNYIQEVDQIEIIEDAPQFPLNVQVNPPDPFVISPRNYPNEIIQETALEVIFKYLNEGIRTRSDRNRTEDLEFLTTHRSRTLIIRPNSALSTSWVRFMINRELNLKADMELQVVDWKALSSSKPTQCGCQKKMQTVIES